MSGASVPTMPDLLAQMHALDAQIQQTDREIGARPYPAHPQGPKESAEWAELQTWWVNKHWRPFVAQWDRGMKEIREYEAGTRGHGQTPLIELITWLTRMGEQYRFLRQSAGASFYIDVSTPRVSGLFDDIDPVGNVSGDEGERDMSAYTDVGAEGQSYPEVASRAVQSAHAQQRSPLYGYLRSGVNQKIYLFPRLEDARAWFDELQPEHDYAAVFSASNLRAPIAGMEHFNRANVSGDHVGNWWPFLLGLPLGGLGGYFLRRWQEPAGAREQVVPLREAVRPLLPGQRPPAPPPPPPPNPKTAGYVGGPWLDLVGQGYDDGYGYAVGCPPYVGGPWLDLVGQDYGYADDYSVGQYDDYDDGGGYSVGCPSWVGASDDGARRREWPQIKALINSAIAEVKRTDANYPAEAYVWKLDAPSTPPYAGRAEGSVVMSTGTTNVVPFTSQREALDYLREQAQTRPVALAMFERSSKHWPNPVAWRKSDEPEHQQVIAQHVASQTSTQSGLYVGADTGVDAAVNEVRRRAQQLAERREGDVIGVIHTAKDNLWHTIKFSSPDDADDWLNSATQDQNAYTYAAYFDKKGESWPRPYIEKIGGFRQPKSPQRFRRTGIAGADAALETYRARAKQLATEKRGNAVGVIHTTDGLWHHFAFNSLDDSITWLQAATQKDKSSFTYAAAFDKGSDGTAYFQAEEVGGARTPSRPGEPIRREVATTSGEWMP